LSVRSHGPACSWPGYPRFLLDGVEKQFGKPADFDNRAALANFTIDDFDDVLGRDRMVVAARLEEERDRAERLCRQ
jgi:hypothetical protein